ncbi:MULTISPECIES: hypothetical protein [unclassified Burkholderia]|uniref:hypothetical protein n=1 Tax=unclassified Burkholderia TaxID=2613784 RepID=UPI002AB082C3|nr:MULTISPECIES: hypothetical protein [unclassified Burkholderia]
MRTEIRLSAQSQAAIARLSADDRPRGANQSDLALSQIRARNDVEAIQAWLKNYESPNTHANYRKEAERFLLWALAELIGLTKIPVDDLRQFRLFLDAPKPSHMLWALISEMRPLASSPTTT